MRTIFDADVDDKNGHFVSLAIEVFVGCGAISAEFAFVVVDTFAMGGFCNDEIERDTTGH